MLLFHWPERLTAPPAGALGAGVTGGLAGSLAETDWPSDVRKRTTPF